MFLGLSMRLNRDWDAKERIVVFIPEYAAYLQNRLLIGEEWKVAYERARGNKPSVYGLEFG